MPYGETKVYFDGSHYIAIPHTEKPYKRRPKKIEEEITVTDDGKKLVPVEEETEILPVEKRQITLMDIAEQVEKEQKKAEEKNALRQPRGGKSPIARLTPYFRCTCGGKLIRIGGKWLDSSELHLKCGSCGSTITTDTDTVLTEANRQIYAHEHSKQLAYAPSAEVIRLSNAINRGLEQPDSPEAVMALILQGVAARYDCCPEPISEYENFDHLPKADWNHFRRVVSYITITQEHIITVQFTDQAGKDE